jgi:hypothetical protein
VTGTVDQELLARNEYLAAENRILSSNGRCAFVMLTNREFGVIDGAIGKKAKTS